MFVVVVVVVIMWLCGREVICGSDTDITALAVRGRAIWLGTRNGYLLILDSYLMQDGKDPLLGLQLCGLGRVKGIVPITPLSSTTSKFQASRSLPRPGLLVVTIATIWSL